MTTNERGGAVEEDRLRRESRELRVRLRKLMAYNDELRKDLHFYKTTMKAQANEIKTLLTTIELLGVCDTIISFDAYKKSLSENQTNETTKPV